MYVSLLKSSFFAVWLLVCMLQYPTAVCLIVSSFLLLWLVQLKKVNAVPLQARCGPEGPRKLWFPDLMTAAQDGGKVVSLTHLLPLPPGNTPGTHFRLVQLVNKIYRKSTKGLNTSQVIQTTNAVHLELYT
jgi:hypothetical protein